MNSMEGVMLATEKRQDGCHTWKEWRYWCEAEDARLRR